MPTPCDRHPSYRSPLEHAIAERDRFQEELWQIHQVLGWASDNLTSIIPVPGGWIASWGKRFCGEEKLYSSLKSAWENREVKS